jgi:sulfonate transport system substrate-binding protein
VAPAPAPRRRRRAGLLLPLVAAAALLAGCVQGEGSSATATSADGALETLTLDYAYYNPASLVLKDKGWLADALAEDGTQVEWVISAGSNKANESLRAGAVQLGSTAGAAALLGRANGSPIKMVDVLAQPEWSAVVVGPDSTARTMEDLRGKRIAATLGTDPYFFLLQALEEAGMSAADVEVVNLQHADGRTALTRGDVDAWAGLDPHMAAAQLEDGAQLIVRNVDFNTYSVLNAREDFIAEHPDVLETVLTQYEIARRWITENPEETAQILAEAASLDLEVARVQLVERTRFDVDPAPGEAQEKVFTAIVPTLVAGDQVRSQEEAEQALSTLFAPEPVTAAAAAAAEAEVPQ